MNAVSPSCSETAPRSRAVSGSSVCCCAPLSVIVTSTEDVVPAVRPEGRLPSATVNVSSSPSSSSTVETVPVADVPPAGIVIDASDPWSPSSDVPRVTVSGTVTASDSAVASVARTVTGEPLAHRVRRGAESDTATAAGAAASRVIVTR